LTDTAPIDVLRALLDPIRLRVLGAALDESVAIADLSARTGLELRDVAAAVGYLRGVGLLDDDGRVDQQVLRGVARELPSDRGRLGEPVEGPWTEREAEILGRFFDGGRLVEMPQSATKRRLVLEKIALEFEPGRRYAERDVNFRIQLVHADYAAVRRYLVDEGFMDRAEGSYWRIGGRLDLPARHPAQDSREAVVLTGMQGVELRPYSWEMVDALAVAANDARIPRFMGDDFPHPYRREDAEEWIELATASDPPTHLAVFVNDAISGGVGGFPGSKEHTGVVEIGWWLHPSFWNRGITTACVVALVDLLFSGHGYMRLWAPVMHANVASARVAEKAGLMLEGRAPSAYVKDGVRYDQLNYGITREQWLANR
jgi:RimJ/RimL family protein N-acetyltransferase